LEASGQPNSERGQKISAWYLPGILLLALALRLGYFGWAQSYGLGTRWTASRRSRWR